MATEYVLDAHALVWYLEENPRLGSQARRVLDHPESVLYLPIIALAEASWVVEHGRSGIPAVSDLLNDVDDDPRITVLPLDRELLDASLALTPLREMHDRLIVATVRLLEASREAVALLSRDPEIRTSRLVQVVW